MKRVEADRLYDKYTRLGAKVEYTFSSKGRVDAVTITSPKTFKWTITIGDRACSIFGQVPPEVAEITVDYLLQGKGE